MSLQVSVEQSKIFEYDKSDLGGSDLWVVPAKNENTDDSILPELPNLHNRESMPFTNFISISRDLVEHSDYYNSPAAQRIVLLEILFRAAWEPTIMNHHGISFEIQPGQLWTTVRQLAEWCGKGVTKNDVERGLTRFSFSRFVRQEVRHGKMLITITMSELYRNKKEDSETRSETKLRQKRDTNKEYRSKEGIHIGSKDPLAPNDSRRRKKDPIKFSFESGKYEGISEQDLSDWRIAYPNADLTKDLAAQGQWLKANPEKAPKSKWRSFITRWLLKSHNDATNRLAYSKGSVNEKTSIIQKISERFKHGEIYNGAECFINAEAIAFTRGMTHKQLKFKEFGFWDQFDSLLKGFGIKNE